ncbi:MAG: RNA methyltransferase [Candidatus Thermofonsia Clade 1 bacterium]|jgi:TrmH family RNA methyltransferase|uniref:RNA methyltransferase n=1 Tax=Candidatus Thermofonsia Clade 1 bacterium TaxID=2364210 RepID=A0A2M8PXL9_9CHLR|nr:MAG: RNA methyltransferase [Candidatus Thermofonsia Clade 1 bacterium]PJF42293.1 MAG: RNA methyltransferase [Candidatus Thermofonsia Clade 1 bacterium]RMF50720.1 MAG: RNA methyltransferase [Chloroflexota bacterium]
MTRITNPANATIKAYRALRHRKARAESGLFLAEGIRLVAEAVQLKAPLEALIYAPELLESPFGQQIVAQAQSIGVRVLEVSAAVFASLSAKENPTGLAAVARQAWTPLSAVRFTPEKLGWVALDSPQDTGNIGTILRTCDAVNAEGVILLGNAADPYDPSGVRASMGAIFSQKLVRASYTEFLAWQAQGSARLIGTSDSAQMDYREADYSKPLILLMGSEREGLPNALKAACTSLVRLPMLGRCDSLNVAVACGVMLYAILDAQQNWRSSVITIKE